MNFNTSLLTVKNIPKVEKKQYTIKNTQESNLKYTQKNYNLEQLVQDLQDQSKTHFVYPIFKCTLDDIKALIKPSETIHYLNDYLDEEQDRFYKNKEILQILAQNKPVIVHCVGFGPEIVKQIQSQLQGKDRTDFEKHVQLLDYQMQWDKDGIVYSTTLAQPDYITKQTRERITQVHQKPNLLTKFLYLRYPKQIELKQYDYPENEYLIQDLLDHFYI